jgi:phosphatidylserine/phosphatidylglycerophosphate/cardiolipin synthase-like enzyme
MGGHMAFEGRPVHDVSLRISGPAVTDLEDLFVELWNFIDGKVTTVGTAIARSGGTGAVVGTGIGLVVGGLPGAFVGAIAGTVVGLFVGAVNPTAGDYGGRDQLSPHRSAPFARSGQSVRIVRTAPANYLPNLKSGETGILEAYIAAIEQARSFIYIENQYAHSVAIYSALAAALNRKPGLEVIMLINEHPDIPSYREAQNHRLTDLGAFGRRPMVGVFGLWTVASSASARALADITQIYIHSKLAIIDDNWFTVGTANLDSLSLNSASEAAFDNRRFFEVNAVLLDGTAGQPATGKVPAMRAELWSEHLGVPSAGLARPPAGGWLKLWRDTAAANVASLNASTPPSMSGGILPYSRSTSATQQLKDAGVNTAPSRLRVLV